MTSESNSNRAVHNGSLRLLAAEVTGASRASVLAGSHFFDWPTVEDVDNAPPQSNRAQQRKQRSKSLDGDIFVASIGVVPGVSHPEPQQEDDDTNVIRTVRVAVWPLKFKGTVTVCGCPIGECDCDDGYFVIDGKRVTDLTECVVAA